MNKIFLKCLILFFFVNLSFETFAQRTVGLFKQSDEAFAGYTIFTLLQGTDVYLIDNCGEQVHKWDLEGRPGMMSYLDNEGNLFRAERTNSDFNGGGTGGRIRKYDWDGNMTWERLLSNDSLHQHHDLAVLSNGNILTILWESISAEEAIELGRNPQTLEDDLWLEKIVELKPIGSNEVEEVWSWRLIDHLIQDFDDSKENYGIVSDHPELVDINFNATSSTTLVQDWIHLNGIDYNEELDQIILSSRHLSEVWIIDHSTTTEEASTSSGGDTDKGGDLLYRWGNPLSYKRGVASDQISYKQHDATWIKVGENQTWGFSTYNNGQGRPGPDYSQIDIIELPILADKTYKISDTGPYEPSTPDLIIDQIDGEEFFHQNISGCEILPNGNALICVGGLGTFHEVDTSDASLIWEYVVPISSDTPIEQGSVITGNFIFKARRYPDNFSGFEGKDLTPVGPIELNPIDVECEIVSIEQIAKDQDQFLLYPNPTSGNVFIENKKGGIFDLQIFNSVGQLIFLEQNSTKRLVDLSSYTAGIYFLSINQQTFRITLL